MNKIVLSITKYRKELFGFSIITILLFHFFEDVSDFGEGSPFFIASKVYNIVFGSVGVDIWGCFSLWLKTAMCRAFTKDGSNAFCPRTL